jgi:hypothetical protein
LIADRGAAYLLLEDCMPTTDPDARFLLDDEPLTGTLQDFFAETTAMSSLQPGEEFTGGGGAWATFTLARVR